MYKLYKADFLTSNRQISKKKNMPVPEDNTKLFKKLTKSNIFKINLSNHKKLNCNIIANVVCSKISHRKIILTALAALNKKKLAYSKLIKYS